MRKLGCFIIYSILLIFLGMAIYKNRAFVKKYLIKFGKEATLWIDKGIRNNFKKAAEHGEQNVKLLGGNR